MQMIRLATAFIYLFIFNEGIKGIKGDRLSHVKDDD